jgi:hypothetical protein
LNTDFFTDKARPNYTFQPFTLQRKVHSRCWKSPLVKTKYTAGPHSHGNTFNNRFKIWTNFPVFIFTQDEESPDIEFIYNDTDSTAAELAELYSYTEQV